MILSRPDVPLAILPYLPHQNCLPFASFIKRMLPVPLEYSREAADISDHFFGSALALSAISLAKVRTQKQKGSDSGSRIKSGMTLFK